MTLAIINSGGANMNSLVYALQRLGVDPMLTTEREVVESATHVILPGVGHASDSMRRLTMLNAKDLLKDLSQPVLGICLGMQLMYEYSEEGDTECLGLLSGRVSRMSASVERPAPHMGWNQIHTDQPHAILDGIDSSSYFYFVHGFTVAINHHTIASTNYGYAFSAVACRDNFLGVQFHPERSGPAGSRLLQNFVNL